VTEVLIPRVLRRAGFCSHAEMSSGGSKRLDICCRRLLCYMMLQVLLLVVPVHTLQLHAALPHHADHCLHFPSMHLLRRSRCTTYAHLWA
jgi:hypothetical protein